MIEEHRVALTRLGFSTRVLESGPAPTDAEPRIPVVLLHGSPDSAGEWREVMTRLGSGYRAIAPDLVGLGACEEPPPTFHFGRDDLVEFVDAVLEALAISEPVIVAVHDIGGVMGVPWAARNLDRCRGIVVTNTVAFEDFPWFPIARTWARTDSAGRLRARLGMAAVGWFGGALFERAFGRASPELEATDLERMRNEFALDAKSKRSTLRLFRKMLAPGFFDGIEGQLAHIAAKRPVRVVWGRNDPYIPVRYAERIAGATSVDILPDHGHWVPLTAADRVAAAIEAIGTIGASDAA